LLLLPFAPLRSTFVQSFEKAKEKYKSKGEVPLRGPCPLRRNRVKQKQRRSTPLGPLRTKAKAPFVFSKTPYPLCSFATFAALRIINKITN
jgi:hypothetical protein